METALQRTIQETGAAALATAFGLELPIFDHQQAARAAAAFEEQRSLHRVEALEARPAGRWRMRSQTEAIEAQRKQLGVVAELRRVLFVGASDGS